MAPRATPLPLPWACLLTAGATFRSLAIFWVLTGAYAIERLFNSYRCAEWALYHIAWFPSAACALDAAILLTFHHVGPPARRTTMHAIRLLLAVLIIAIVPHRVWWWSTVIVE